MSDSYYRHHLFICTFQREDCATCCNQYGGQAMRDYAKQRIKDLGLSGEGGVRVNSAGCLGRCNEGPVAVVYPEGVWYTYIDHEDLDEIIESHLQRGKVVERLRL